MKISRVKRNNFRNFASADPDIGKRGPRAWPAKSDYPCAATFSLVEGGV